MAASAISIRETRSPSTYTRVGQALSHKQQLFWLTEAGPARLVILILRIQTYLNKVQGNNHQSNVITQVAMTVSITTLSENTAGRGCLAEWGLSILVEVDGAKILVDTGASFSALHNARRLGIDLQGVDAIVLSHGHRDHTGGLRSILKQQRSEVRVIAHPDIWANKYARSENGEERIGIPFRRDTLERLGARFELSREPLHLTDRVMTSGEIPMYTDYEVIEDNLLVKPGAAFRPDSLADDLALVIQTDYGLIVVLGCAHRGIINTLHHAQHLVGEKIVYAVIGGTHLFRASPERVARTIADLKQIGVQRIGISHCTGFYAAARLADEFPEGFFLNNAGTQLTLVPS